MESLREFEDLIILAMLTGCFNKQSIWLWKNHIDVIDSSLFPDTENGNSWIGKVRVHVQHYPDYKHWFINIKSNHICKVHSISDIIFCWSIFLVSGPKKCTFGCQFVQPKTKRTVSSVTVATTVWQPFLQNYIPFASHGRKTSPHKRAENGPLNLKVIFWENYPLKLRHVSRESM